MATQNLGAPPSRPNDQVDVAWVTSNYPSYSSFVSAGANFTLTLLSSPVNHTMLLCEVYATNAIVVSVPTETLLTVGCQPHTPIPATKTGFFGLRYSANAGAWFLLSATTQV